MMVLSGTVTSIVASLQDTFKQGLGVFVDVYDIVFVGDGVPVAVGTSVVGDALTARRVSSALNVSAE
jgi:hypothetical protein